MYGHMPPPASAEGPPGRRCAAQSVAAEGRAASEPRWSCGGRDEASTGGSGLRGPGAGPLRREGAAGRPKRSGGAGDVQPCVRTGRWQPSLAEPRAGPGHGRAPHPARRSAVPAVVRPGHLPRASRHRSGGRPRLSAARAADAARRPVDVSLRALAGYVAARSAAGAARSGAVRGWVVTRPGEWRSACREAGRATSVPAGGAGTDVYGSQQQQIVQRSHEDQTPDHR